jgi:hypothetical protein
LSREYTKPLYTKPLRKVKAEDLVRELTQEYKAQDTDGLDAETILSGTGKTLLPLRDATVTGTFDLIASGKLWVSSEEGDTLDPQT